MRQSLIRRFQLSLKLISKGKSLLEQTNKLKNSLGSLSTVLPQSRLLFIMLDNYEDNLIILNFLSARNLKSILKCKNYLVCFQKNIVKFSIESIIINRFIMSMQ